MRRMQFSVYDEMIRMKNEKYTISRKANENYEKLKLLAHWF